jgi:chromosome segregation ATPase
MDAPDKLAKSSVPDSRYRWLTTGYLPIGFAAAGCAAAIAIALEAKGLSDQRSVLDRGRPPREKLADEKFLMRRTLIDRRPELTSIEAREKNRQHIVLIAQYEIEKAQKDKADAIQETDKAVKEGPKLDFDRAAAEKRIEAVRDKFEDQAKRLAILKDKFMRGQVRLASLIDQQAKLQAALPQMTIDETRLQGMAKRLEEEIRATTRRRDAVASDIDQARSKTHELSDDRAGQMRGLDGFKRLTDDLRKQSEHALKDVAELERKRAMLALQARVSTSNPSADQSNEEARRDVEIRSQDAELDAKRIELEQNIKVLQQQKDELVKTNKSFQEQLDAAAANLASVMEQVRALEPDRREALALQAQLEELNRQIDERRKIIDRPVKPASRSRPAHPGPLGATEQPPRGAR